MPCIICVLDLYISRALACLLSSCFVSKLNFTMLLMTYFHSWHLHWHPLPFTEKKWIFKLFLTISHLFPLSLECFQVAGHLCNSDLSTSLRTVIYTLLDCEVFCPGCVVPLEWYKFQDFQSVGKFDESESIRRVRHVLTEAVGSEEERNSTTNDCRKTRSILDRKSVV